MERDNIIAVVLVVVFVFLAIAFVGLSAATLFLAGSGVSAPTGGNTDSDDLPIIDTVTDSNSNDADPSPPLDEDEPVDEDPPAPVCGNGTKETGEQCESNSDCTSAQVCSSSCTCAAKPPENVKLTNISVNKLTYWCAPDFGGQRGLVIKIIELKNSGTTNFTYDGAVNITAVTGDTTDSVNTKAAFKTSIAAGKTQTIYQKDLLRDASPFIFLGNKIVPTKITLKFGNNYIEYDYTLKAKDFSDAGCL